MVEASTTYRCGGCAQLLPFDERVRVPDACLRRCEGRCDWTPVGATDRATWVRCSVDGELGPDGIPVADDTA